MPRLPFRQLQLERDILDELQFHLDCRTEANVECGMSASDARQAALSQFGDPEDILDACLEAHEEATGRRAARYIANVLPLGLACGFVASVLFVLYALVIRPPATYPDHGEWVAIWWKSNESGTIAADSSIEEYLTWRENATTVDYVGLGTYRNGISIFGDEGVRVMGKYVAGDYLRAHGIVPLIGHVFGGGSAPSVDHPVVLSYNFWQQRFEGSRGLIGKPLVVDGIEHTIVGVAPEEYQTFYPFDFFAPLNPETVVDTKTRDYLASARLNQGVTRQNVQEELNRLIADKPASAGWTVQVRTPQDVYGERYPRKLIPYGILGFMLFGTVLIRGNLKSRFSSMSSLPGAALGVAAVAAIAAVFGTGLLRETVLAGVDQRFRFTIDPIAILGFAGLVFTTLVMGRLSMMWTSPVKNRESKPAPRFLQTYGAPVVTNALAFLLLVSAMTVTHDWMERRSSDPGFDANQVFAVPILVSNDLYKDRDARRAYFTALNDSLDKLESVDQYSFAVGLPTIGETQIAIASLPRPGSPDTAGWTRVHTSAVDMDFFETMGIRVVEGKPFVHQDDGDVVGLAAIGTRLAERHWPHQSPLGERFRFEGISTPFEITAVVDDVLSSSDDGEDAPMLYPLIWHWTKPRLIAVRTQHDFEDVAAEIQRVVSGIEPVTLTSQFKRANEGLVAAEEARRRTVVLTWVLALLALALSSGNTFTSMAKAGEELVRRATLNRADRFGLASRFRPLLLGLVASLVIGFLLSSSVAGLLIREMSLRDQVGVLCILIPAAMLVASHCAAGYLPVRQIVRLERNLQTSS